MPPDWPDAGWIDQGDLTLNFAGGSRVRVFAYEDPQTAGVCTALTRGEMRTNPANSTSEYFIRALGVICQSAINSNACFWDSRQHNPGKLYIDSLQDFESQLTMDFDRVRNGSNLMSNCTDCHQGQNAFLIHPGTSLALPKHPSPGRRYTTSTPDWYVPIGQSNWTNSGPSVLPGSQTSGCLSCHGPGSGGLSA